MLTFCSLIHLFILYLFPLPRPKRQKSRSPVLSLQNRFREPLPTSRKPPSPTNLPAVINSAHETGSCPQFIPVSGSCAASTGVPAHPISVKIAPFKMPLLKYPPHSPPKREARTNIHFTFQNNQLPELRRMPPGVCHRLSVTNCLSLAACHKLLLTSCLPVSFYSCLK